MPSNGHTISPNAIFTLKPGRQTPKKTPREVGQDKYAPERGESVLLEPVPDITRARTQTADTQKPKHHGSRKRRTQQVAGWVLPHIKAEVLRIARQKGWSESKTVATLLDGALQRKLGEEYATILSATLENAVLKTQRAMATRFASLLVRIAFDTGQTRVLTTNILGRQEGMNEDTLKEILDTADRRTKANLTRKTPQLSELVAAVEKWLLTDTQEGRP